MVPVHRPLLPAADRIAPYLERIDLTRCYTNFGPLVRQLEERLARHFGAPVGGIATISNATVGLQLGLSASGAAPSSLCLLPAWTFVASPLSAMGAGLVPYFVDVDPATWTLSPEIAKAALGDAPGRVGVVMPVSPFGSPIESLLWDRFTEDTGVPVVIDAAAGFDTVAPTRSLAVVSLHATKVLGAGEGAFVMSTDVERVAAVRSLSTFGFQGSRNALTAGTNAKLSEYSAAVALAALDSWPTSREEWRGAATLYGADLRAARLQRGWGVTWVSSTLVADFGVSSVAIEAALRSNGVETRRWWGSGAHRHRATAGLPRAPLPQTERLADQTLGLPFSRDLAARDIDWICRLLLDQS